MPIVSLSLPEQMIKDMEEIQKNMGFTGRSELVRSGIRLLLQDIKDKDSLSGSLTAVVVLAHNEENEEPVTRIKHKFDAIIKTHIHDKIAKNNCIELFLLEGTAGEITAMAKEFQREDGIKSVRLVTI